MSSKEWLPAGMDPNTSYLLNIRLVGDPSKCRAEWYEIDKVVDADMINFKDFVDDIADKYPHGYGEIVTVMYFDAETKTFPQVRTDQELLEMFAKHTDSKVVYMTIAYTLPNAPVHIPKRRKKNVEPSIENSVISVNSTPTMIFPPSQGCDNSLSSGKSVRSASGSNQPQSLAIDYPLQASGESTPPAAASKPKEKKNAKGKTKKKQQQQVVVAPSSPAMGTRSKMATPDSPAMSTRSKKRLLE